MSGQGEYLGKNRQGKPVVFLPYQTEDSEYYFTDREENAVKH